MKKNIYTLVCILFGCSMTIHAQNITTVVGIGSAFGYSGDGANATAAKLSRPESIAFDASGNMYIADYENQAIRKITPSGIISTFAGLGTLVGGYNGDGIPATDAQLNGPTEVATDASGNVYISDYNNNRIRKVNSSGIITTIAGDGFAGFGGDGGAAITAQLNGPGGMAIDVVHNIYFCDLQNRRVRKISESGIISTIAGDGSMTSTGDGGPATAATFMYPCYLAMDAAGSIYISDYLAAVIRKIEVSGNIKTIAGNGVTGFSGDKGPATSAQLYRPLGLAIDAAGNLLFADWGNNRIRMINPLDTITTIAGTGAGLYGGDGGPASACQLKKPYGVEIDCGGNLFIVDDSNYVIREVVYDRAPVFLAGHKQSVRVCSDSVIDLSANLSAKDVDNGQTQTWSIATPPLKGIASVAFSAVSTGGTMVPTGLTYRSDHGFVGSDSIDVKVSECGNLSDITTIKIRVKSCIDAGVKDRYNKDQVLVHPNPVNSLLHVDNLQNTSRYMLHNTLGQTIQQGILKTGDNTINIHDLPVGSYILTVIDDQGARTLSKVLKR